MWYLTHDRQANEWHGPFNKSKPPEFMPFEAFETEKEALRFLVPFLEDDISKRQGNLTRMRLRISALAPGFAHLNNDNVPDQQT